LLRHVARLVTRIVAPLVDYSASSTTSSPPRVWVPRHVARLVAPLVVDYSSSTTSSPPRVRVPRHVARLATRLVAPLVIDYFASRRLIVDYSAYAARPGASARHAARHTAHHRLLRALRLRLAATLALLQPRRGVRLLVSRQHCLYFEYAARRHDVIFPGRIASTIHLDYFSKLVENGSHAPNN
jgi:hypothetical protein